MKRSIKVIASAVVVAAGVGGFVLHNAPNVSASQTPEQSAQTLVQNYIEAEKQGNVNQLMALTDDQRFPNDAMKKEVYQSILANDQVKFSVVSFQKTDDTHMTVLLHEISKVNGTHDIQLPVVNENGQWKLVITDQTVTKNNN